MTAERGSATGVPAQGQLVEVRQRHYVVAEARPSTLPPDPLALDGVRVQHLLTLSSVEDDALGEELRVVWEVEPGARLLERAALPRPDGFDAPARFDAFMDAVRWGSVASADSRALQAPFRSGIAIEDYQLDPVVRALQMPRANLLIADDVGLGKTIEAGLVIQELLLRNRARSVLVVCPSSLQLQWRDQLRDKFGLEFRVVDADLFHQLRRERGLRVNPWTHFPRLITSIDLLKRDRPLRLFGEALPASGEPTYPRRFDVLIVDEAHNVAPAGRGRYAVDSLRTAAIRRLAPHFEHKLFLSATPHNGYPESFSALLELVDNQRFARGVRPDPRQLGAVMVRRLKSDLPPAWDGSPRFPTRILEALEVAYTPEEERAHALLRRYSQARQGAAADGEERVAAEFVLKLLKKRLFSSPEAFAVTLAAHQRSLEGGRERRAARRPSPGILRRQIAGLEEEFGDDAAADQASEEALTVASGVLAGPTPEERQVLDELREWAERARGRPDSKARALLAWLRATLRPGGGWNDERVIIFTEYRDTQRWLHELLANAGLGGQDRLLTLYGGMRPDERERIKAAFQAGPADSEARILLATDAASEGIDLQNHCARVVHVEIPWNPNRLEQRNGRIDRHGQRETEVRVYHFVGAGWRQAPLSDDGGASLAADLEFLFRAAQKVEQIREDLGRVGPVIAAQVEEAMLGRRRALDTEREEAAAAPVRQLLKTELRLRERLAELRERVAATRQELRLSPENVRTVVEFALELADQPPLQSATVEGLPAGNAWQIPALRGSWAACTEGLLHPHTQAVRPIVFDHALAEGRDDVVLAHLQHRLVQMALRLLRAEVWAPAGRQKLHRVTARVAPDLALETPALVAHARLLVLGGDGQRLHEELIAAGGALRDGRFARLNVGQTAAALAAGSAVPAPSVLGDWLRAHWDDLAPAVWAALEARGRERTESLARVLREREEKELADSRAILTELRRAILAELEQPEVQQLSLFSDPEREQFERNIDTLRARAERIPAEITEEATVIRARYADQQLRLFPVGLTFLVPAALARRGAAHPGGGR